MRETSTTERIQNHHLGCFWVLLNRLKRNALTVVMNFLKRPS
jgi:hypothetical protein